jgi:uncharacterized OB-fold protein
MRKRERFPDAVSEGGMGKDLNQAICRRRRCGKEFLPKRSNQRFCCPECKKKFWAEVRQEGLKIVMKIY